MANKAISELPQAQNVNNQDLFVLEQSGIAKKLTAETFITEQGIIDALAAALDGHGGIQSVTLSSVSGRIRTYRITFTDQSATTFQVYDGTSIDRISRTSSSGLDDVYTIFLSDGTTTFFTVHNGADGNVSEAMLNDALKDKAPAITETTESSAIANFADGADDMVMHNVVVEINPVQDLSNGDPSPDNICPITGWTGCNVTRTGANLFDKSTASPDTTWTTSGTQGFSSGNTSSALIPVQPSGTYYIGFTGKVNVYGVYEFDINKNYIGRTFPGALTPRATTLPSNCYYVGLVMDTTYKDTAYFSYSSTATTYEPYQSTTLAIDWTTEAGTVYGGTIDVATGLLTVTKASYTFDGSETFIKSGNALNGFYTNHLRHIVADSDKILVNTPLISDSFKTTTTSSVYVNNYGYIYADTSVCFSVDPTIAGDTVTSFTTWLSTNNVQVVYELATPQTYQLTPQEVLKTLLGTNNVWADTGNVSVTYPADTKMFIEKLTMPTEDDLVANQAITSGKYFMIGNSLYLALANIASGAQITIGTNAQRVSLADALNTINS